MIIETSEKENNEQSLGLTARDSQSVVRVPMKSYL